MHCQLQCLGSSPAVQGTEQHGDICDNIVTTQPCRDEETSSTYSHLVILYIKKNNVPKLIITGGDHAKELSGCSTEKRVWERCLLKRLWIGAIDTGVRRREAKSVNCGHSLS